MKKIYLLIMVTVLILNNDKPINISPSKDYIIKEVKNNSISYLYTFILKSADNLSFFQRIDIKENPEANINLIFKSKSEFVLQISDENKEILSFKNQKYKSLNITPIISSKIEYKFTNLSNTPINVKVGFDCRLCNIHNEKGNEKFSTSVTNLRGLSDIKNFITKENTKILKNQIVNLKNSKNMLQNINKFIIIEVILILIANFSQILIISKMLKNKSLI